MKLLCSKTNPPLGGFITAHYLNSSSAGSVEIEWGDETIIQNNSQKIPCPTSNDVQRFLARTFANEQLYGNSPVERTEVDHWLTFSIGLANAKNDLSDLLKQLDLVLGPLTYLAGKRLTIADFAVFAALYGNKQWQDMIAKSSTPSNVLRWYNFIQSQEAVEKALAVVPAEVKSALKAASSRLSASRQPAEKTSAGSRAPEGKFVDLPGAEMGKVVVRFPPEASGYLHIGHAKAALLNQYYQQAFQGKLILRFDDTNPAKEDKHFEQVILEDVEMLEIKPDMFTHTSQYFDLMLEYCEKLIKEGKAYVDDTDAETMKQEREQRIESVNRNNSIEKNMELWNEMKKGTERGQQCCVRAKIDMQSPNGCMRDPTIYRCKNEEHPRTGTKYKVYPTYDFACPIVDAIEGVTHTLRTMEYHDRDAQFYWFIDALGLRKPYIWEYSRLSMMNTVLSKRKLAWFVEQGLVDGWDDPRMPTVRGVLRRGMTVEGLKEFIIAQGSSRSVVFMEWDKIWAFNKKVIDPIVPRYTSVDAGDPVTVLVKGAKEECLTVPKHPKNADVGIKTVWVGPKIIIDRIDAESIKEGERVTFINWGNLMIKKVNRENGKITTIEAEPNLDNKDYKKTLKLTFLAETEKAPFTPTYCVYFDHLISKNLLGKDEDFKQYVNHETRKEVKMLGDPELKTLKKGDIIQLQRKGFFRVDVAYQPVNLHTCKEQAVILFYIPDGHTKESPMGAPAASATTAKNEASAPASSVKTAASVNEEIITQGNLVRSLKGQNAPKSELEAAIKVLLSLKAEYKQLTNTDWKPGCVPPADASTGAGDSKPKLSSSQRKEIVNQLKAQLEEAENSLLEVTKSMQKQSDKIQNTPSSLNSEIIKQGDIVRNLKAQKAPKAEIDAAVKILLSLKADYKKLTNIDWKPGCIPPPDTQFLDQTADVAQVAEVPSQSPGTSAVALNEEIIKQGNIVRNLKSQKAAKQEIDAAVKILLSLKADYKNLTNTEWKPGCTPPADVCSKPTKTSDARKSIEKETHQAEKASSQSSHMSASALNEEIIKQGNIVRSLKTEKAPKQDIDAAVKILLSLKADYKALTNTEWKPGCNPPADVCAKPAKTPDAENSVTKEHKQAAEISNESSSSSAAGINEEIIKQGNIVRNLKAQKAPKQEIDAAVKVLLSLKADYKNLTNTEWKPGCTPPADACSKPSKTSDARKSASPPGDTGSKPAKSSGSRKSLEKEVTQAEKEKQGVKKQTRLGLEARKEENVSEWYSQVITKSEMLDYYNISGCYIFRPWSLSIWEEIVSWFNAEIKKLGVQNCYFPMFVSKDALEREKQHIADFSPEVAWVTKSGDSEMAEPIAIRPTSETVMYPAYAKWIQSYRDLPLKLNQWNNVVRWEFKHPQPFMRTREFLWQEGHTAYAEEEEAMEEVKIILDLYAQIYEELLAIPVVKGRKTEKEKFAGGVYTLTTEAFISASGRAIQGATSHHLGQNFSKMFDIVFEDPKTLEKRHVYQNSWGLTTRTIGVMIMVHSDNQGLVLPPRVAMYQVVIVPCGITVELSQEKRKDLESSCKALESDLRKADIKVHGDYRSYYSPGWKYNHWELKGVPIRIELGPKDILKKQIVAVRRDTGEKIPIPIENAVEKLKQLLDDIHKSLFKRAKEDLEKHTILLTDWADFTPNLDRKNIILAPFCGVSDCEDKIKQDSMRDESAEPGAPSMGAKSLCIPLEQPKEIKPSDKCIHPACTRPPRYYTLFGRSY